MPIWSFAGQWQFPDDPYFVATRVNQTDVAGSGGMVSVQSSQFEASVRYKNQLDKDIDYHLLIQRSTGRFSESYTNGGEKMPFSENQGRCIRLPLK
jgi:hypothetical protein